MIEVGPAPAYVRPNGRQFARALFQCDCGRQFAAVKAKVKAGRTRSCGCKRGTPVFKHGSYRTPEYRAWTNARYRCTSPKAKRWEHYGGRGIRFSAAFDRFEDFLAEVGPRPSPQHSLDRIDNDGHYEPGNLRWATTAQQNRNRR